MEPFYKHLYCINCILANTKMCNMFFVVEMLTLVIYLFTEVEKYRFVFKSLSEKLNKCSKSIQWSQNYHSLRFNKQGKTMGIMMFEEISDGGNILNSLNCLTEEFGSCKHFLTLDNLCKIKDVLLIHLYRQWKLVLFGKKALIISPHTELQYFLYVKEGRQYGHNLSRISKRFFQCYFQICC